ncbi:MAG: CDF family Co(II)/Ni(II) efflux transporter DmeF [Planctomycetota bacterium]|nr:CDF family Co(II)/Ni(II) efflux transporter DmeF [Planctomycetota bacterium]MDA1251920.1 CDF family Co(II)/Ni(II) efflux transporter DmeF [Planctomycetota bacterium]
MTDSRDNPSGGWLEDHSFGQEQKRPGEARTLVVVGLTAVMMIVEVAAGLISGSMALLADGLHMAAHTAALGISVAAYVFARKHAHNRRFSFGTGKVNALGGFTGGVLLVLFSLMMAWESSERILEPVPIAYSEAIIVAVLGLVVNAASAVILGHDHSHDGGGASGEGQGGCGHDHDHDSGQDDAHSTSAAPHDHNLRSAWLHVVADALTSVAAIAGLLAGKYFGLVWVDPAVGILGSIVVANWSIGLLRTTGGVLLDLHAPEELDRLVREKLTTDNDELVDFHIWTIGPGIFAVEAVVVSSDPQTPDEYRNRLPSDAGLAHVVIEVHAAETA